MGFHKAGLVSIGAFVEFELRDYIDKLSKERGFSTRSDALRTIICEHRAIFLQGIDGNPALTPSDVVVNDNHTRCLTLKREVK